MLVDKFLKPFWRISPIDITKWLNYIFLRFGNWSFAYERHRHRYEVDPDMVQQFEDAGLSFTGKDESDRHMEVSVAIDIGT
uniref:Auxin-induced SAUR n=1 Tax=Solanum tuberosum TaxID=4113 RepID=M0ZMU8_SOLTU